MNDIVSRLRYAYERRELPTWGELQEAADEIEELRKAVSGTADLNAALLRARAIIDEALGND